MTALVQRIFLAATLVFALMSYSPKLRADSKPADPKKVAEAQAWLDTAEKLSLLTEKGSPPFVLQVTVERRERGEHSTASFYFLWQDAQHWRAMAVDGDARELRMRNPEGLWRSNVPNPKLISAFARGMAFPFRRSFLPDQHTIVGLRQRKLKDVVVSCVELELPAEVDSGNKAEACVDRDTGLLRRMSWQLWPGSGLNEVNEYIDYISFNGKWVPREVKVTDSGQLSRDARVVQLSSSLPTTADLFVTPPGYEAWPDCEHYRFAHLKSELNFAFDLPMLPKKIADFIFVIIGPDGYAQDIRFLNPTGRPTKKWVELFANRPFEPAACDGKPVMGDYYMPLPQ